VVDRRWRTVLTVTPYLALAMMAAFALGVGWGAWARLVPELALCAVYALWLLLWRDLPLPWRDRPVAIVTLVSGAVVVSLLLVLQEGFFAFVTVATFMLAYSQVRWPWQMLPVAATAAVAGFAQGSSFGPDPAGVVGRVLVIALNVVVMCGLGWGVELAQRHQRLAATEAERARLAREIHDTLAQGFAGIVTQLQAADQSSDEADRRRHTDAAMSLAREGLAEARRSVQALRPAALDALGLAEALVTATHRWSTRTGIPVEIRTTGDERALPTDAEVALLRSAQEALANVERHAHAHRVALTLRYTARGARLEVRDDGRGFDPAAAPRAVAGGGYGLVAMRERVEAVAGDLVVESAPGQGTAVRVEVPA
jgi:signal transduction histidine kinase